MSVPYFKYNLVSIVAV